ncbi:MAG: DUF5683 domain-containing protein [Rikenellaceae bacterium]
MSDLSNILRRRATAIQLALLTIAIVLSILPYKAYAQQQKSIVSGGASITLPEAKYAHTDSTKLGLRAVKRDSLESKKDRFKFFSDSVSLSRMCWTATFLPGYGQIYNKQYWKLPIFYGIMGSSLALFINENKRYKPLRDEFDQLSIDNSLRTEEMDAVQTEMIRSNTRRQLYIGAAVASFIYTLGDAAVNYSTNEVSSVKKATTLATICPGAGQIYNKAYWKVPFVVGGFASIIYVLDWNNRGYKRFGTAYTLRLDYDLYPENYPDGSIDEFGGRYTASYLKSLRDSYRRNRDLSIILGAGLYILQIIDAHVDAHLKDYDISDDLTMNIEPSLDYAYVPAVGGNRAMMGFNINLKF